MKLINYNHKVLTNNMMRSFLGSRIAQFLTSVHPYPRTIYLTRHGESEYNAAKKIGGDSPLSLLGREYAERLGQFAELVICKGAKNIAFVVLKPGDGEKLTQSLTRIPTVPIGEKVEGIYPKGDWSKFGVDSSASAIHPGMRLVRLQREGSSEFEEVPSTIEELVNIVGSGSGALVFVEDPPGGVRKEVCARLWTSSLKRTQETAEHIPHPSLQLDGKTWKQMSLRMYRNLDEVYAGEFEGLTYEVQMPDADDPPIPAAGLYPLTGWWPGTPKTYKRHAGLDSSQLRGNPAAGGNARASGPEGIKTAHAHHVFYAEMNAAGKVSARALKGNQGKQATHISQPLIEAAKTGEVESCRRALAEPKIKVDQKDPDGISALMHAALDGHLPVVKFLVEKGSRISAKDDIGETALVKACKEGHVDILKYLIDAQMAQRKKSGPLGGGDAQKTLEQEKKRILDAKDDEGVTALMKAVEHGEEDVARALLEEGASLDPKDDEGWNVMMWAALAGEFDICEMLVRTFGVAVDYVSDKGETALMKAAANGHWEVCEFLVDEGAKVNQADGEHQTALMWSAAMGHMSTVKGLLGRDAKIDVASRDGKTALAMAAQLGRNEICSALIEAGAKVDHQDTDGQTALFGAVASRSPMICQELLTQKCPLEAHTKRGQTALMWAAIHQQLDCLKVLLEARAEVNTQDENGQKAADPVFDEQSGPSEGKAGSRQRECWTSEYKLLDNPMQQLETFQEPILLIAHQAVHRLIYAFLVGIPRENATEISIPLHTVIKIDLDGIGTIKETRYMLGPTELRSGKGQKLSEFGPSDGQELCGQSCLSDRGFDVELCLQCSCYL
ncbi:unnamed protein product [Polarella glacialis]|uniref:Uncharacterized protein n=1 Tax=Polarella glacialis TaxID=89957 RepID=A0A813JQ79_POLGL|nr:unnamed protein product [Polarella glacialis]